MYLKIRDTSHKTAFLSEGGTETLYGESQSIPFRHTAVHCAFDLILNLTTKSRSKRLRISVKNYFKKTNPNNNPQTCPSFITGHVCYMSTAMIKNMVVGSYWIRVL